MHAEAQYWYQRNEKNTPVHPAFAMCSKPPQQTFMHLSDSPFESACLDQSLGQTLHVPEKLAAHLASGKHVGQGCDLQHAKLVHPIRITRFCRKFFFPGAGFEEISTQMGAVIRLPALAPSLSGAGPRGTEILRCGLDVACMGVKRWHSRAAHSRVS